MATDVSATDISAKTFRPRTCKMPKVDVSAITINSCTFECTDLVGSMLMCVGECMYMYLHACMQGACPCYALLWFSSYNFYSFYSCRTIKFLLVG